MKRILISIVAVLALAVGATVASARGDRHGDGAKERLFTLAPDPAGNPEGVAVDKRSKAFYVSITAGGDIYRGTLGSDTVEPFIEGEGGAFRSASRSSAASCTSRAARPARSRSTTSPPRPCSRSSRPGPGGFLNDLVVTPRGDVFVTDSFRPMLWHVTGEQVEAGCGTPQELGVSGIVYRPSSSTSTASSKGSSRIVVVDSNSGNLFRIELDDNGGRPGPHEITGARSRGRRHVAGPGQAARGPGRPDS